MPITVTVVLVVVVAIIIIVIVLVVLRKVIQGRNQNRKANNYFIHYCII